MVGSLKTIVKCVCVKRKNGTHTWQLYILHPALLPEEIKQELTSLKVGSVLRKLQGRVPQSEVSYILNSQDTGYRIPPPWLLHSSL